MEQTQKHWYDKTWLIVVLCIFFFPVGLYAQDFEKCKVDFSILESQTTLIEGNEYIFRYNNIINCELKNVYPNTKTEIWWEKYRNANEEEIKEYKKRYKSYYKNHSPMQLNITNGINIPIRKAQQQSLLSPEFINDTLQLANGILYSKKTKVIRNDLPIFWIQDKDSSLSVQDDDYNYTLPIGMTPVFDLSLFNNSTFFIQGIIKTMFGDKNRINFIVGNKKITLYNYKYRNGDNDRPLIIDVSINLFYDKSKLIETDNFFSELKSKDLIINQNDNVFVDCKISSYRLFFDSLQINFSSKGKEYSKTFHTVKDPEYKYDYQEQDKIPQTVFDLPIYYSDCYNKIDNQFKNLTLKSNYINNPNLNKQLYDALSNSREWMNYEIIKVILTNQSQWTIRLNRYTGLQDSRITVADAYVRNTWNDNCYYQSEVMFI
jgi:hypothetical protein